MQAEDLACGQPHLIDPDSTDMHTSVEALKEMDRPTGSCSLQTAPHILQTDINRPRRSQIHRDRHLDHPHRRPAHKPRCVHRQKLAGTQTPPHSQAVPPAQARTEPSPDPYLCLSALPPRQSRPWNDARGSPAPTWEQLL